MVMANRYVTCSATDFRDDLKKFDVPDDQIVPIDASGKASAKPIKNAQLIVYRLNQDLLDFIRK